MIIIHPQSRAIDAARTAAALGWRLYTNGEQSVVAPSRPDGFYPVATKTKGNA